ncbi:MAG: GTPase HflX [Lachnospiraceae bacterium]|nr:GTPase HflX [Lachnospiraceae bacterium]
MAELIDNAELVEQVILVGVATSQDDLDVKVSLKELGELCKTAGAVPVATVIQNREKIHPGLYIGTGKIEEVAAMAKELGATGIVCDDELSPAQLKNLSDELEGLKVMDRTLVILDIFAKHATTSEGKIQVELAQLKYRMSRLAGMYTSLSRLGGGIGTRGPGEKKIEMDRRNIRDRIGQLGSELKDVEDHRELLRNTSRKNNPVPVVAIVGYTNAGKSTLLNRLTDAGILAEDMLFATLDPTTRALKLPGGETVHLTDTVGFIRKLPHHLIEAFKSTLEEAKYADVIVHVVDASNPDCEMQMQVVYDTLRSLGVKDQPIITLFNKQDRLQIMLEEGDLTYIPVRKDVTADVVINVSAKTGVGVEKFLNELEQILANQKVLLEKVIPYSDAGKIQMIRKYGTLLSEEYVQDGVAIKAYVPKEMAPRFDSLSQKE